VLLLVLGLIGLGVLLLDEVDEKSLLGCLFHVLLGVAVQDLEQTLLGDEAGLFEVVELEEFAGAFLVIAAGEALEAVREHVEGEGSVTVQEGVDDFVGPESLVSG
jgi:hypothetical protein